MINVLEFSTNSEYKFAWNYSTRTLFYIFENLTDCMILYKYKLSGGKFILRKFGINNPDKIIFNKLNGENLILFHLDIYKESTHKLRDLLDYCLENNIDVYLHHYYSNENHIQTINEILEEYHINRYEFKDLGSKGYEKLQIEKNIIEKTKLLIREINLKKLLG